MRSFKQQISHSENTFYFWTWKTYGGLDLGDIAGYRSAYVHFYIQLQNTCIAYEMLLLQWKDCLLILT